MWSLKRAYHTLTILCVALVFGMFFARMAEKGVHFGADARKEEPRAFYVVVDAGHGGIDGGAVGTKSKVPEAGLNLSVALLVEQKLRESGIDVSMTRTDENALADGKKADMQARKKIMNRDGVDVVVSIHMNRFKDPGAKGAMAFYMPDSQEGQKLAELVLSAVCEETGQNPRKPQKANFFILRESLSPAVLVECGFLSNAAEEQKLLDESYQELLANGIVKGVIAYLKTLPVPVGEDGFDG